MILDSRAWIARLAVAFILSLTLALSLLTPTGAYAAFGLTSSNGTYTVDTGAGLVFKVNPDGNIISLNYKGIELQDQSKFSHIASGFFVYGSDTMTVTGTIIGSDYIKITVNDVAPTGTLIHYYLARRGYNNIYMATYITAEPNVGELRYIARLQTSKLPNCPQPSSLIGTTGPIESSDVFGMANGETRSKYYGRDRAMDLSYRGVSGPGVGVYMIYDNRESSSGGPFFRDIQDQTGAQQELYNYMNSGHMQTEPIRTNVLYGPYVYAFTDSTPPALPIDTSWIHSAHIDTGIRGWVQNRGHVTGTATGIPAGFQGVVGFANAVAQYWCTVVNGRYTSPWIIPGDYTMTLYKGELAVATDSVTVPQSTIFVTKNIASTETTPAVLWRIGEWDGTPAGFLNADKLATMHPTDIRMGNWGPVIYNTNVGTPVSLPAAFPAGQWKDINNPTTIRFNLAPGEVTNHTLRIGLTCAYAGGRPQVRVNGWTSKIPSSSSQPDSRSLTVGTYRGNNVMYTYDIPASAFVVGTNTIYLTVVSGSGSTGFLSAGYAYDAVELDVK